ncbi:unnamed protein product [Lasius platythorax]
MKRLVVLTVLFVALSAGQVHRMPSSYKNGVKWEFGTDIFRDVLARSNVDQAPAVSIVYKNKPIVPVIRKEPVVATVYKKTPVVPDVYQKKFVLHKQEPVVQNIRKQQSAVFKARSVASNIYKSEPVVQNVYKQQAAVPIVRKEHSVVSNIYRSQPIRPIVHHQQESPHHFVVSRVLPADSQKKLEHHVWNYQYNPHHSITRGNAHVVAHN